MEQPTLKRGIFGFSASSVRQILADRERMFIRVSDEAKEARASLTKLDLELAEIRREKERLAADLELVTADADRAHTTLAERDAEIVAQRQAVTELTSQMSAARAEVGASEEKRRSLEITLTGLREQLDATNHRVSELEGELDAARVELDRAHRDLAEVPPAPIAAAAPPPAAIVPATSLFDALSSAEDAMSSMVADAKRRGRAELERVRSERDRIEVEIHAMETWRARIAPVAGELPLAVSAMRERLAELSLRIANVLSPTEDAISELQDKLSMIGELAPYRPANEPKEVLLSADDPRDPWTKAEPGLQPAGRTSGRSDVDAGRHMPLP
jgi:chromosome segregation ATPase